MSSVALVLLLALACPVTMLLMMLGMRRDQRAKDGERHQRVRQP